MMVFLDIVTIVCIGLLVGVELAVSAFVNPVLWKLEDHAQASAISLFAVRLGTSMPFWYGLSLLLLIAEAVMRRQEPNLPLLVIACVIWTVVIVTTVLFLVPINNRMARLNAGSLPEKARQEHKKWDTLHRGRVAAICAALVCFLFGGYR